MISSLFSRLIILFFGTLYPAYASYKAVRTKNVKEYVKWMMYWIVFAFFTCIETFTDIFLSWFPFYYEVKVVIVLWLLSPATKGSSTLYRKFVHPMLTRREQEIDEYLNQARERGYSAVLQLGSKGVNYATNVIMQTAIKGGGNLVQTIKRSYSLSDLSEPDVHRTQDELDDVMMASASSVMMRPQPARHLRQRHQTPVGRSASGTRHSTGMYFTEVDVSAGSAAAGKNAGDFNYNIRSTDDISSGYSSAEPINAPLGVGLSRTSSMTNASKARVKSKRNEQILGEMRSEVFLENERYFEVMRAQQSKEAQRQKQLKIAESEEVNDKYNEEKKEMEVEVEMVVKEEEEEAEVEVDHDTFYEAMDVMEITKTAGEEMPISTNKDVANEQQMETERLSDSEESFKEALNEAPIAKEIDVHACKSESVEIEDYKALVDPFLLVVTESSFDVAVSAGASSTAQPVSPRELLATLEEIKHNFRAQLEPETTPLRPKAQHTKGRAPAPPVPPLPPRKDYRAADSVSLHSTQSLSQLERSKSSGIGHLFKSFKDNVLRKANQQSDEEPSVSGDSAKETSI
ncbi:PREDICTED: uncharacterized protein LOC108616296 isoform X3 [Drosophila arizonae]|uniref:Uncharacterized protein LOC108616296 isoform X3 n=1 Tax=Drosophila arizonae TaxID=7263 RepID=A0ABM1PI47_DROAR|nr:PREDICTED: uncharacterized protein LOC108616296 isoform X3 [Drosophila arizonae]